MMKTLIASLSIAALAAPAFAQQPTTPAKRQTATEEKFAKHDTNKDGALSIDEVKMADAKVTTAGFEMYDADKDKAFSKDEFAKWAEAKTTPPASAPGR
ncbi:MAG: EF-hand domain-containing protein [Hyphomonadaceae bacterium]|nr:EF-hand domain-containing protein [Hyphomonadaceae bacterium]